MDHGARQHLCAGHDLRELTAVQGGAGRMDWRRASVGSFETDDEMAGLGDITITPILLGWHNDAEYISRRH